MKKIFLLLLSVFFVISAEAQKGSSQFALFAGYEHFPEMWVGKGYNVGVEYIVYKDQMDVGFMVQIVWKNKWLLLTY